jgi:hypothetical protein
MLILSMSTAVHLAQSRDPRSRADWFAFCTYQRCSVWGHLACSLHYPPSGLASSLKLMYSVTCLFDVALHAAMSSSSSLRRKTLASDIARNGTEMAPCTKCRNAKVKAGEEKPKCIVGPQSEKCSECVRKGLSHCDVTLSAPQWARLRDARDALRRDIERIEEEEVHLLQELTARRMKKIRLRKQLRLSEDRTNAAASKELAELDALDAAERSFLPVEEELGIEIPEYPFEFHGILEMPPASWDDIWHPDATTAVADGTLQSASATQSVL